ncbi:thiamine phosphate synthase [Corynebacterium glyciniphilum]|uniref:Thiamine-phosphate synthase n=1 Tax=Corynebacterium glyciniphilum AJ 3170 TaxID=1404245 RepID=X5DSI2_9CORY|nr:thiamine phosphate synthase [Corynebacterium glyciniphilum]AHW64249.1 Multifunctional thiamine-phosphate pyrophosphorylase/synthase/phosphomethylpyrimidine kinase [Corynebacterium glyciniphilum AJ 3170]
MNLTRSTVPQVDWGLYLVTDPVLGGGRDAVADIVAKALHGGVSVVQLRDKTLDDDAFTTRAVELADILAGTGVPLFINDRIDIAGRLGLHLHIGQDDIDFRTARAMLPDDLMIGLSVDNHAQIREIERLMRDGVRPPDVLGLGPVELTDTKTDTGRALGVTGPGSVHELAAHARELDIPSVAIGHVNAANAAALGRTAVAGICVVSAIMSAADPTAATRELRSLCPRPLTPTVVEDPS